MISQVRNKQRFLWKIEKMNIVLDACALIAFFKNEIGAEIVEINQKLKK